MNQMTSRERILAAMKRRPVDYVPCAPFMNPQDWCQRVGKLWQYPFGPSRQEMLSYMVGVLGVDQVSGFSCGYYPEPGISSRVWMEGDIIHKSWSTPSGEMRAAVRYNDHWPHGLDVPFFSDYNPAHYVEPWIKSHQDVECLRHVLLPPQSEQALEQVRFDARESKALAREYGLAVAFSFGQGLTGALQMFGAEQICEKAVTEPDLVEAYLEVDHRFNMKTCEIALDLGVDIVRRNGFYETCDFFSPAMLQRFLGKHLREEISLAHEAGAVFAYIALTGIMPMLDYLTGLDFDCLLCPDIFFHGADGREINARLGDRKSFWTGPSDTIHMPWDNPEEVRKAVQHVFHIFGKTGLIITPCSSSKAVFPWSNVLAMVDEWKKLR